MSHYIFEVVKGDQHLYITQGEPIKKEGLPLSLACNYTTGLDPKPRNALRVEGFKQAKGFLDSIVVLKPTAFRKLVKVDANWERPIVINMRRCNDSKGLVDCVVAQRMYTFKEQE